MRLLVPVLVTVLAGGTAGCAGGGEGSGADTSTVTIDVTPTPRAPVVTPTP